VFENIQIPRPLKPLFAETGAGIKTASNVNFYDSSPDRFRIIGPYSPHNENFVQTLGQEEPGIRSWELEEN
ncbi:MAG: hypothetical protein AB1638_12540, partial [Nitrospirota bacterium]